MARRAWILSGAVILTVVGLIPNSFIPRMTSFALADSLNVRPGTWDISITTQTGGSLIPPNLLAKMPPEQRAKIEQSMQARSGKPMTHSSKECVTQEDLDQDRMLKEQQEQDPAKFMWTSKAAGLARVALRSKIAIEQEQNMPQASIVDRI